MLGVNKDTVRSRRLVIRSGRLADVVEERRQAQEVGAQDAEQLVPQEPVLLLERLQGLDGAKRVLVHRVPVVPVDAHQSRQVPELG